MNEENNQEFEIVCDEDLIAINESIEQTMVISRRGRPQVTVTNLVENSFIGSFISLHQNAITNTNTILGNENRLVRVQNINGRPSIECEPDFSDVRLRRRNQNLMAQRRWREKKRFEPKNG